MRVSYMVHHVAVAENPYQGTKSFLGCTASLLSATLQSRVAHVDVRHRVYAAPDVTWQVGSCS